MAIMYKSIVLSSFLVALLCALLFPVSSYASSQPTFKMEIVAPECVLDTIDDGSGPVLVITCPPGTVNPPETDNNGDASNNDTSNDIVASGRIQSPADTVAMLEVLESSGMSVELPEGFNSVFQPSDNAVSAQDNEQYTTAQNTFTVVVLAVATILAVAIGLGATTSSLSAGGLELIHRLWSRWFR